jgi:hypothetical protein
LKIWNRLPAAQPTVKVTAKEAGLPGDAVLLEAQLLSPAYRQPAELKLIRKDDAAVLTTDKPVKLQLHVAALPLNWPAGSGHFVPDVADAKWNGDVLSFQLSPGTYRLSRQ